MEQSYPEDYVRIFDTTLRDGEQSPGCTMNVEEKIAVARQLERLNVDIIEAGFAASSPGDFEAVRRVADAVANPVVLSLSRTRIRLTWRETGVVQTLENRRAPPADAADEIRSG